MAEFNNNPTEFVDFNDLFPVLNEKVGLTYEQWRKAIENINFVKANLGVSDVEIGNVNTSIVEDENLVGIDITTREGIIEKNGVQRTVIYLDFDLRFPSGRVKSVNGQTGDVVLTSEDVGAVQKVVGDSIIDNTSEKIILNRLARNEDGTISDRSYSLELDNYSVLFGRKNNETYEQYMTCNALGLAIGQEIAIRENIVAASIRISNLLAPDSIEISSTKKNAEGEVLQSKSLIVSPDKVMVNSEEIATITDIERAIGNVSTLLGDSEDLEV